MTERDLFLAALEVDDPAGRAALLDRTCGGDSTLRKRVEDLLAAADRPGSFMADPAADRLARPAGDPRAATADPAAADTRPAAPARDRPSVPGAGAVIAGRYELLREVGEGGM